MIFEMDIPLLAIGGALALRFSVLAATMPMLDMRSVPPLWRVAIAFCFSAALAPGIAAVTPVGSVDLSWQGFALEAMRSLVIGAMLGFTINLTFTAVKYAGSVAGMQIGFAIVNAFDPMTQSQVSVISQLYYIMAVLLFFVTGAHQILVGAMFQSCVAIPPFSGFDPTGGAWYLMKEFGTIFVLGLRIAGPIIIILLLVSASMGVIVKTVPQINILAVGFPVKIAVGLITFGLSLIFFKDLVIGLMGNMEAQLNDVLVALK
jgi:flagellar biosynthesis protein FliR